MIDAPDLFRRPVTARDVSRHGRPAESVPHDGMPAYESESGTLFVMECLVVHSQAADKPPIVLPASYGMVALRAPSGLAALHDAVDAVWSWRPMLYTLFIEWTGKHGSQQELEWRIGLHEARLDRSELNDSLMEWLLTCAKAKTPHAEYEAEAERIIDAWMGRPEMPFIQANQKAERILAEHLSPLQRIDLAADGHFYVRGTINKLYAIEPGNGAMIVDPLTHEPLVSLCLHTDDWIPHADVALATKLAIESGREGEEEMLAGANPRVLRPTRRATSLHRRAWAMERELLPAQLVEVS